MPGYELREARDRRWAEDAQEEQLERAERHGELVAEQREKAERDQCRRTLAELSERIEKYRSDLRESFGEESYLLQWAPIFQTITHFVNEALAATAEPEETEEP